MQHRFTRVTNRTRHEEKSRQRTYQGADTEHEVFGRTPAAARSPPRDGERRVQPSTNGRGEQHVSKNPIPARIDPKPPEKMPPRCPAWQWFVNLFNIDSHSQGTEDRPLDIPDKQDNHNARASDTALLRKEFQQGGNTNSHEQNTTKRTTSTVRKHKAKG